MTDENETSIPEPIENEAQAASELPPDAGAPEQSAPSAPEGSMVAIPEQPSPIEPCHCALVIVILVVGAALVVIVLALLGPSIGRVFSNVVVGV